MRAPQRSPSHVAAAAAVLVAVAVAAPAAAGCSCSRRSDGGAPAPGGSAAQPVSAAASSAATPSDEIAIDATTPVGCQIGHAGVLLDLGDASMRGHTGGHLEAPRVETVEREGATWTRFRDRSATFTFTTTGPGDGDDPGRSGAPTFVEARVSTGVARSISVYVNGKAVGPLPLPKGSDPAVVSVRAPAPLVVAGENEVTLHFNGAPKASAGEALADVDWIHVGNGDPDPAYAAPTRADVASSVTLGGVSHRVIALRAPAFLRCDGWFPRAAQGRLALALGGPGDADVEVRILRDRKDPLGVYRAHLTTSGGWQDITFPTGADDDGFVGALDVEVTRATKGTRVLLGDPRVVAPPRAASNAVAVTADAGDAHARGVVLVVFGDLQPKSIAPYGGALAVPELTALAQKGLVFDAHRASSSISSAALAAMLTGRLPASFGFDDGDSRLPASITTIEEAARRAGVVTALFTANPMTSAAFGFDRGWETFAAHPPSDPGPAARIFEDAAKWVDAHKGDRFLLVVHARGGHPPWDVAPEELKDLAPPDYSGGLDPQHAAELLSKARHVPPTIRFNDADRARAWALYGRGVQMHDAGLGKLLAALKSAGREADTAIVVTGDISVNDAAHVPFGDSEPPTESGLGVPLIVRWPPATRAGGHVPEPTSDLDLAPTLLDLLGLPALPWFEGTDVLVTASGRVPARGRARIATANGRLAARLGSFVLTGTARRGDLCDLALEPACLTDVRATHPIAWDVMTRAAFEALHPADAAHGGGVGAGAPPVPGALAGGAGGASAIASGGGASGGGASSGRAAKEPATLDAAAQAALKAWGR